MKRIRSVAHTIRFPYEIYQFVHAKAKEEHRTFNAQIVHYLAEGIKAMHEKGQEAQNDSGITSDN